MHNKVLLILVDGMRPESIPLCGDGGYLENLFRSGTYTMSGETVFPPVTLPVHLSLFYGVRPEIHGTLDNVFVPPKQKIRGLAELLAENGKKFALFYTWEELQAVCSPGNHLSFSWYMGQHIYPFPDLERRETEAAILHIHEFEPDTVFLYLGGADEAGHQYGWMSEPYLREVRNESVCIARVMSELPNTYSVIVVSDHGGHGYTHGNMVPEDMTIPMAMIGKEFSAGKRMKKAGILDIAPTVTEILGIKPDKAWEGKSLIHAETF